MSITTILFDLDGTLYPNASGLARTFDERITDYVARLLDLDRDQARATRQRYFTTYGTTLRGLQQHHAVDADEYLAYIHDLTISDYLLPDPELDQLLGQLRSQLAIFTNSPIEHARGVLQALGVAPRFAAIFDVRFFSFQPKPEPAIYQLALDALGAGPRQTALVEDTAQNLGPARALGMTTLFIDETGQAQAPAADERLPDIYTALRRLRELEEAPGAARA